ncbi:polysaccharide biosynthesis protein [Lacicoccus alkaliphilus]|uniref:NDP-sugar epimerase, includes UDP-GlcNAc-inverting 4,6-dehydratase FlaA1 and capsular polysaccharide biosynthesis protein EpsC n=1 Tax=Lacicoccus alkaliphilus DSM 16010 TaxID=1123231 RepID=A0A1M7CUA6_9BACL|nr:nucleoside-diphosphate sugar epimerase/dehydratase [Salinicoccus alkaliphilus]SHL70737.1 NDP-sugar epimerase, includes UDP-GlcNAc-inverting 4,6-dehydratase FlaA1 and capsular polysaccharide biosynthesis protein EpsC [Salinicoccus alkaliphilus DSM 16010]
MGAKKRYFLFVSIDSLIVTFSIFISYYILIPFFSEYSLVVLGTTAVIILLSHHIFAYIFNLYHRAWLYAGVRELTFITMAVTATMVTTAILTFLLFNITFFRLTLITWMMHLILIGGSRMAWRILNHHLTGRRTNGSGMVRTLIVGAGKGGTMLIRQMIDNPSMGMNPVAIVDDDEMKRNLEVAGGIRVEGDRHDIARLVSKYDISKIVIAIPSLSKKELNKIHRLAHIEGVDLMIMPNIEDILCGKLEVGMLKQVEVEDLLGREPVELDMAGIEGQVTDKTILVTGAGGSIGSEIVRQIAKFQPRRILLLGHGENSIYTILEEVLDRKNDQISYIPIIADVQNRKRIFEVFERYRPDIVYHAAAHKHVPMMEYNPVEAIRNNVIGTKNTAEAACHYRTKKFVMISTDKAVNPPNVMGATKRVAEMIVQALDKNCEDTTLVAVRFGNVLGSNGSVVPKFKRQIEAGGPITVTDPRMTRYFMTIPEASRLVIQASTLAEGGEVFVLDMGEPVKIVDLAKNMIRLSGFSEDDIGIEFVGVRPGEKLYEELLNAEEIHPEQVYEKIYRGRVSESSLQVIEDNIKIFLTLNEKEVKETLINFVGREKNEVEFGRKHAV